MLFHITQVHRPESCPLGEGGSNSLFDADVDGLQLIGRYGANAQHTLFYVVDAVDVDDIQGSFDPVSRAVQALSRRSARYQFRRTEGQRDPATHFLPPRARRAAKPRLSATGVGGPASPTSNAACGGGCARLTVSSTPPAGSLEPG